ncbi:MAG: DMT family transporter [Alphaproteobacteria bacterium]|nr:DMT family transporter [Alphaproteobacteria bacterium]
MRTGLLRGVPANLRGALFMVATTMVFSGQQALVRLAGADVHPFVVAFWRSIFGLIVLLPLLRQHGLATFKTTKLVWHVGRGVLQTVSMLMYFLALTLAPLTQNVALSFTAPLYTAILAVVLLGERLDWPRLAALVAGIAGAWIVIRPGLVEVNAGSALVLFASLCWGGSMTIIKYLSRTDSPLTITMYMGIVMTVASFVPALFVWSWPTPTTWIWLILIGACAGFAHLMLAEAFRSADVTTVLPFDYARIIWVSALGYFVFAEVPTVWTLAGGTLIFAAATFIAIREGRRRPHVAPQST